MIVHPWIPFQIHPKHAVLCEESSPNHMPKPFLPSQTLRAWFRSRYGLNYQSILQQVFSAQERDPRGRYRPSPFPVFSRFISMLCRSLPSNRMRTISMPYSKLILDPEMSAAMELYHPCTPNWSTVILDSKEPRHSVSLLLFLP
jgi:hypothetical protein